jgi:hypothetical protein
MTGWQPITTAPKDGRRILLCRATDHAVLLGHWDPDWYGRACWVAGSSAIEASHWMPLPEPPEGGA